MNLTTHIEQTPRKVDEQRMPTAATRKKFGNIQSLRAVAVLLVILFHLVAIENKYGSRRSSLPAWFGYGMSGVDLFFVISGFVMVTVTRGKFGSLSAAGRFLYQRATRIYPLYWIYSLIVLAVFLAKPSLVNSAQGNQVHLISSFLLLPDNLLPLLNVGWSLIHEIYFYLIFALFLLVCEDRSLPRALILWTVVLVAGQAILYSWPISLTPTSALVTHPMTYEFIAGCAIGILIHANITRFGLTACLMGMAMFILMFVGFLPGRDIDLDHSWLRVVLFGTPAALLVYGAVSLEVAQNWILPRWLERIGDASYSIYLSHVLVLSVMGRIWKASSFDGVIETAIILALMGTLAVGFGLISYHWVELPLLGRIRDWRWAKGRVTSPA